MEEKFLTYEALAEKKPKALSCADGSAKIDLEKRLSEVGGNGFSNSSSSESIFLGWKGECSRRHGSDGPQSPSLDQVIVARSKSPSSGPRRKCVGFSDVLDRHSEEVLSKDEGSQPLSPSYIPSEEAGPSEEEDLGEEGEWANWVLQEGEEGEMLVKPRYDGLDNSSSETGTDSEGSSQENGLKCGNEDGLLKPLEGYASIEVGEIKLSVVLPITPPKSRKVKSKAMGSKMHGMRTRRDKCKEKDSHSDFENRSEERESEEQGNLDVARALDFNSKMTDSWNLEEEVSKVAADGSFADSSRWLQAISVLTEVIMLNPCLPDTYHTLGLVYDTTGNAEKAAGFYELAAEINPKDSTPWWKINKAKRCLKIAVRADPSDITLRFHLASLHVQLGDCQRAAESYGEIVQLCPENVEALKTGTKVSP
ncbi:hypothetical protein Q3G72_025255 [Acer saccharum]|nr:hypothetical protein Q3G72_025255 [Acer saccharum]